MTKKLLLILILTVTVSSCNNSAKVSGEGEMINYIDVDSRWEMSLDTLLTKTEYISLETTPESLLGDIQAIKTDDSLYFIKDATRVLIFGYNGEFINQAGMVGRGSNEYTYIHDFFLDRVRKHVCIIDRTRKKVFKYDYNGRFHESVNLDLGGRQNKFAETDADGNLIIYYSLKYAGAGNSDYQYGVFSLTDGKYIDSKDFLENYIYSGNRGLMAIAQYPVSHTKERVLLLSGGSNIIYEYKNGILTPAYMVQTDKAIADKNYFEKNKDIDYLDLVKEMRADNSYFSGLNNIIETSQYLMLLLEGKKSLFWDKKSGLGISVNQLLNPLTNSYSITMSNPFCIGNGDHVVGFVNASQITPNKDKILTSGDEKLVSLISSIDEYSNPVLCRYYFKNDAIIQFFN